MGGAKRFLWLVCLLVAFAAAAGEAQDLPRGQVRLSADTLTYDPESRLVRAEGSVHLEREGLDLKAGFAEGDPAGERFRAWGPVKVRWPVQKMELSAQEASLVERGSRKVVASGQVVLTRPQERLAASELEWVFGPVPEYVARGAVVAEMPGRRLEAREAGRKGDLFWAAGVSRFEERTEGISLKAGRIEARSEGQEMRELTATGEVSAIVERAGEPTVTLKGDKLLYSKAKGTVALVGNAQALQEGRSVKSETLLYDVTSRRIEAQGRPQLVFTPNKENKAP